MGIDGMDTIENGSETDAGSCRDSCNGLARDDRPYYQDGE